MNFSPFFKKVLSRGLPSTPVTYQIDGDTFNHPYWLADGIYPDYAIFVTPRRSIQSIEERFMNEQQESERKDIECAFGMLQQRFHILRHGMNACDTSTVQNTILTCGIIHNILITWKERKRDESEGEGAIHKLF